MKERDGPAGEEAAVKVTLPVKPVLPRETVAEIASPASKPTGAGAPRVIV